MSEKELDLATLGDEPDLTSATDVEAEVIETVTVEPDAIWKPRLDTAVNNAIKTGNLVPVFGAVAARNDDQPNAVVAEETKRVTTEMTISQCLKDEMSAPNAMMTIGDDIVTNARAIGKVLVNKALAGDMSAIREVLNRTEGKVPNVTHNSSASVKVSGDANSIAGLMAKIDKNKKDE